MKERARLGDAATNRRATAVARQHRQTALGVLGLGGLFAGLTSPLAGAPGAVLLYVLAALAVWVSGEAFGGVITGSGTGPNTGPLLVLPALALYPARTQGAADEMVAAVAGIAD